MKMIQQRGTGVRGIGVPPMSLKHNRGLAVIVVITLFTLISAALLTMSLLFAAQARRTRATQTGAQLRQLLLAATTIAQNQPANISTEQTLTLPTPVPNATLTLHLTPNKDGTLDALATAKLSTLSAAEHLTLIHKQNAWSITTATLTQSP